MANLARLQSAVGKNHHIVHPQRVFRYPDDKPWRRFSLKAREVIVDWSHSIAAAVMVVTLLMFAAMAILVILYAVLFLAAFIMSILG